MTLFCGEKKSRTISSSTIKNEDDDPKFMDMERCSYHTKRKEAGSNIVHMMWFHFIFIIKKNTIIEVKRQMTN